MGWFGGVLAFVGLVDVALVWVPPSLGNAGWAFATVQQSFASLPLLTMGIAGLFAAGFALRRRTLLRVMAGMTLALTGVLLSAFVLYLLSAPVALSAAPPPMQVHLYKAIVKTILLAIAFPCTYIVVSVAALQHSRQRDA